MYLRPPSTLPPGSIVDSYRRDSGGMRQDKSTDQQLSEIEAFCKAHNLVHRHRFVDEARSGGSTVERDDFLRMMKLYGEPAERPRGLLLWNHARFARDIDDAQLNKIRLRQWGIIIHSLNDPIPEGDYGKVIEFLIDVANEEKRKQTSTDAKRGLKELVEKYGCVPGTPPRGIKRTPVNLGQRRDRSEHIAHRWDPDPDFIPGVQQAFAMKAAGSTLAQIQKATHLFSSQNSYKTFFENKIYIGILEFADLTIEHYCAPIIDRSTWDAVQRILALHADRQNVTDKNGLHPRRRASAANYLLSGIAHCARCDSPLWGMTSGQRNGTYYLRYACTKAKRNRTCDLQPIPAKSLEREVISHLTAFFDDPGNLQALLEEDQLELSQLAATNAVMTKDKQKQLRQVRRSIANITEAIAQRKDKKKSNALNKKLDELEAQETDLQSQLHALGPRSTPHESRTFTADEIIFLSRRLVTHLQEKDNPTQRAVLQATVHKLIIDRHKGQVHGIIQIHTPREPETPEEPPGGIITACMTVPTVGAPYHTRSIEFSFPVAPQHVTRKSRPL